MTYPNLQLFFSGSWENLCDLSVLAMDQTEANRRPGILNLAFDVADDLGLGKSDRVALRVQTSAEDTAGTLLFTGKVVDRSVSEHTVRVSAASVFYDLEHILFETSTVLGADKYSPSHLTLFRDENADPITIGAQIKAALDYAASQGILVSYQQSDLDALDIYMPGTEALDLTVAEVIKKALPYRPDIVTAVEYSGDPEAAQRLRFIPRSFLSSVSLSAADLLLPLQVNARYDLQIDGVVFYYYWMDRDADGVETYRNSTDFSGLTSGPNVLKQTVPLLGTLVETTVSVPLVKFQDTSKTAYSWRTDGEVASFVWFFWRDRGRDAGYTGLPQYMTIDNVSPFEPEIKDIVISEQYAANKYLVTPTNNPGGWAIKILNGRPFYGSCNLAVDISSYPNFGTMQYVPIVIPATAGIFVIDSSVNPVSVSVRSTPDEIPEGLAAQLFSILNPLQYDGNVVRFDDLMSPSGICSVLRKLNITDSDNDLQTMNAVVQQCAMDYLTQTQTLKFGPPDHLQIQDFISMARTNRDRRFALIFPSA